MNCALKDMRDVPGILMIIVLEITSLFYLFIQVNGSDNCIFGYP